jgi:hypothetical protein
MRLVRKTVGAPFYGSVALLGCGDDRAVISGPRFVLRQFGDDLGAVMQAAEVQGHSLYLRVRAQPGDVSVAREHVRRVVESRAGFAQAVAGWEVEVDGQAAREVARSAAIAARSAGTLRSAADAYFEKSKFEGVEPEKVRARVYGYLGLK